MLVAPRQPSGPEWKPVMGGEVLFDPIDRPMMRRARRAALAKLKRDPGDESDASPAEQLEELGDALSEALILSGARDWRNVASQVFDAENKPVLVDGKPVFEPLPFTAENLALSLSDPIIFDAFDAVYVMPFASRERAKNGSAASPSGIGAAATQGSDTANSPVEANTTDGAKAARTPSKPPRTRKKKGSGTS